MTYHTITSSIFQLVIRKCIDLEVLFINLISTLSAMLENCLYLKIYDLISSFSDRLFDLSILIVYLFAFIGYFLFCVLFFRNWILCSDELSWLTAQWPSGYPGEYRQFEISNSTWFEVSLIQFYCRNFLYFGNIYFMLLNFIYFQWSVNIIAEECLVCQSNKS